MMLASASTTPEEVTLHTEGVDRNSFIGDICMHLLAVTLHTEGVDRNIPAGDIIGGYGGHPPHGGRG